VSGFKVLIEQANMIIPVLFVRFALIITTLELFKGLSFPDERQNMMLLTFLRHNQTFQSTFSSQRTSICHTWFFLQTCLGALLAHADSAEAQSMAFLLLLCLR
jgi:hypothetical protein